MDTHPADNLFAGSIPELYDRHFVPLLFEPYALDLCRRVALQRPKNLLEIAAGTGALTRALAATLPAAGTAIVATDLSLPMLERAQAVGTSRAVEWRQADAMRLPFEDGRFDFVVCQFGAMFFADKPAAFAEARRVLAPGGRLLFNVWDRIEENEFAHAVMQAMAGLYPVNPAEFMTRAPHGYHDVAAIAQDLKRGGFQATPAVERVTLQSRAASARLAALAFCQATPLRNGIEALDPHGLARATEACAAAIARQFGAGPVVGRMQAHVVTIDA